MTEDPVKLYVVVMAILLAVLTFVAYSSYNEAEAYANALDRAPREAKDLKELSAEVLQLCDQLSQSQLNAGRVSLVENTARRFGFSHSNLKPDTRRIPDRGVKGKEEILVYEFGGGRTSKPQTRDKIAQFCQAVERDSRGILKTIEIALRRKTTEGGPAAGEQDKVTDDAYSGTIIFGLRTVD